MKSQIFVRIWLIEALRGDGMVAHASIETQNNDDDDDDDSNNNKN